MSTFNSDESLRGITNFVVAANSSSFTEASEKLGITKSAVGKSIARLGGTVGYQTFSSLYKEAYLNSCTSALEILDSAEINHSTLKSESSNTLLPIVILCSISGMLKKASPSQVFSIFTFIAA